MLERLNRLDEARRTCGCFAVADVGLDAADDAVAVTAVFLEDPLDGRQFDFVAQRRAGAVAFDEAHACHGIASSRVGTAESAALALHFGGGDRSFAIR